MHNKNKCVEPRVETTTIVNKTKFFVLVIAYALFVMSSDNLRIPNIFLFPLSRSEELLIIM